jgi:hypothetical protein
MNVVMQKVANEVLYGSGNTNTPEPEELRGLKETRLEVRPVNGLHSVKPIRRRQAPNRTFHRYCPELWSIRANRLSVCPYCRQAIKPGDEITLFESVEGWAHLSHAVSEAMPNTRRLGGVI